MKEITRKVGDHSATLGLVWRKNSASSSLLSISREKTTTANHNTMIAAANTPHTITNVLMICFSSETDIASGAPTTLVLGSGRGRHSHESALRSGVGKTHARAY